MNRRRRYWIDSQFQSNYLRTFLTLQIAIGAVIATLIAGASYLLIRGGPATDQTWLQVMFIFVILALVLGCGLIYLGIRVSHRICGPVIKIQKALEAAKRGEEPGMIQLRRGDELQELADALNETLHLLHQARKDSTPPRESQEKMR